MKRSIQSGVLTLASLVCGLSISARAETLDALLARMDQNAKTSTSFSATVKQIDFTSIIHLSEESTGTIRLKRTGTGVVGVFEYQTPSPRIVHFTGGDLEEFLPKANVLDVWKVGS
ncbi:MAG: hypothetical protein ABI824_01870, partial [Acidobacteriota bacterium]